MSGHFTGAVVLPHEWGALHYVVELGGTSPGWLVLALGICAAADFAFAVKAEFSENPEGVAKGGPAFAYNTKSIFSAFEHHPHRPAQSFSASSI